MILALGAGMSLGSGDWRWFSRSGSVIVAIGILLTSTQIRENMDRLRQRRDGEGVGPLRSDRDWAHEIQRRYLRRSRVKEEDTWEMERSGLFMLIAGTLIWGFGDLLGGYFS